MRFVYVVNALDRDILLGLGYRLVKEDPGSNLWIFKNKDTAEFSSEDYLKRSGVSTFVMSDTLTF